MKIVRIKETDSTNRYVQTLAATHEDTAKLCVRTDYQTAGKGMGCNTWESERGKNLLFSLLVRPQNSNVPVKWQYLYSMCMALAVREAIDEMLGGVGNVRIKWPNDIYIDDRKVSGTLINLTLGGSGIKYIIIGTGVNVNQTLFRSDAPNPVSLQQVVGREFPIDGLLTSILAHFEHYYALLMGGNDDLIVAKYHEQLWRGVGYFPYVDVNGPFEAEIVSVGKDGILQLRRTDGTVSTYEFKEVKAVIN